MRPLHCNFCFFFKQKNNKSCTAVFVLILCLKIYNKFYYFELNTCIVTNVSGVNNTLLLAAFAAIFSILVRMFSISDIKLLATELRVSTKVEAALFS